MIALAAGTQEIEVFVHAVTYSVGDTPQLALSERDISSLLDSHMLLCTKTVTIDVPEFDVRTGQVEALNKARVKELARHENALSSIDRDINTLLALTHEV